MKKHTIAISYAQTVRRLTLTAVMLVITLSGLAMASSDKTVTINPETEGHGIDLNRTQEILCQDLRGGLNPETEPSDRKESPDWWWNRLKGRNLDMKDSTVIYPRFLGFCVKVYNWADRTFNSYDTTYVAGTGKRWKAVLRKTVTHSISDTTCLCASWATYTATLARICSIWP